MTTNLTNGTQVSIDPAKLPVDWQAGQNYTIILNPSFVTETDNNRTPSPYQTSTFATFSAGSLDYTGVNPGTGSTGVFTSTVFINYNRPIQVGTTTNYYLYKSDGTLVSTIPATSTRVKRLTTSSITWLSSTTVVVSTASTSTYSSVSTSSNIFVDLIPTNIFTVTNWEPPNSKSVYTTITKDISGITTTTEKQIRINLTGNILPSTEYHLRSDEGVVVDMFKFKSLPHIASTITKFTSGAGPTIVGITPAYNTTTNINAVTLQFSKVMTLNTGNFYLNDNTGTIKTIPVIGPTVSLLNTNTVQIVINNTPTPEDDYFLAWDEGVLIDTNTLAIYGVSDDGVVKFFNQVMQGLGSKIYDHSNPTYPFTTATITDLNTGSYQLSVSSPYGEFSHLSAGTNGGTYWSMTGTPAQINTAIPTIKFVPTTNFGADTNYHWVLTRDSVPIYDRTFDLIGGPYQLPVAPPGDPDNVNPTNRATLTFSISSLGVIDEPVALTATIVSYVSLGGTVEFKNDGATIATASMSTSGFATTTTIFYSTGTKIVNAVWLGGQMGNPKYGPLTSNTASVFIDRAAILNFSIRSNDNPQRNVNSTTFIAIATASTTLSGPVTFGVYNTSTRAFTQILGTSSFVNNSATITVNSGTFSVGTYTIAAVWTGSNVIPKYYASTATMSQSYVNKGPVRLVAKNPSFYWHNIDGVSLDTQAFAEVTISGIYSAHQPTGIVKLFDGANQLDSMDLSQRTIFSWNPTSYNQVDAGNRTLTVQYLGDEWNLTATTSTAFNTVTQTTSSYLFSAYTRRSSSMTLSTTATTSTIYRPYGAITFKAQTTSSYWNNKIINVREVSNTIATAAVTGTTATFVFDSKDIDVGPHSIRTQYPQDWAYNEIFSNISTFTVAKTTLPITLTRTSATVLRPSTVTLTVASTASFYTNEIVQIYDNGQLWFTATYTGTSLTLTTSSSFFSTGTHIIKAGIAEDFNYNAVESSTSSIFIDKSKIPLTLDTQTTATIYRPSNITFQVRSTGSFNVGKTIILKDNGVAITTATYTGTATTITTSSSYIDVGSHNFEVSFVEDNDYYGVSTSSNVFSVDKQTRGAITLTASTSTITRPNTVVFTATTSDSFYNGKSIILVNNNQNIGSMTFTGFTATTTISTSLLSVGSNEITARFVETNDVYPTVSNISTVTTVKQFGGKLLFQGPTTTATTYVSVNEIYGGGTQVQNNPFNVSVTPTFTFTITSTSTYFNGKIVGLYMHNEINQTTSLLSNTTISNGSGTFVISSTSSQFAIYSSSPGYRNYIYVHHLGDEDYTTSTANTILSPNEIHGIAPPDVNGPITAIWPGADLAQSWILQLYRP
jgi:hypothetical protein